MANNYPRRKKNAISINEIIFIWNIDLKVNSQILKRNYRKIPFYQKSPQTIREKLDWDYTKEIKTSGHKSSEDTIYNLDLCHHCIAWDQ